MSAVILPRVLRFKATFNSIYKCEKASWDKEISFDFCFCYITVFTHCYEPGVTRKKWKWNQQQVLNY